LHAGHQGLYRVLPEFFRSRHDGCHIGSSPLVVRNNLENHMQRMSMHGQIFEEIFSAGATHSTFWRFLDPDFPGTEYWSAGDPVSKSAQSLAHALAATLTARYALGDTLRIRTRILSSEHPEQRADAVAAVLYCRHDEMQPSSRALSDAAARMVTALRPAARSRPQSSLLRNGEMPCAVDELLQTGFAPLLGTSIATSITARIPGRGSMVIDDRFVSAPAMSPQSRVVVVRGKICGTKGQGRFRSIGVDAICSTTRQAFKQPKVAFDDDALRELVACGVREPWRRAEMAIRINSVWCGRADAQVSYHLESLRYVD
jgi:hypothetical protein